MKSIRELREEGKGRVVSLFMYGVGMSVFMVIVGRADLNCNEGKSLGFDVYRDAPGGILNTKDRDCILQRDRDGVYRYKQRVEKEEKGK